MNHSKLEEIKISKFSSCFLFGVGVENFINLDEEFDMCFIFLRLYFKNTVLNIYVGFLPFTFIYFTRRKIMKPEMLFNLISPTRYLFRAKIIIKFKFIN